MNVSKLLSDITQYLTEAFVRIFSPTDDEYPAIGTQPYEGEVYQRSTSFDY